jgi:hypothetical protein
MSLLKNLMVTALSAAMIVTIVPVTGFDVASAQPVFRRPPPPGGGPGFRRPPPPRRQNNGAAAGAAFGILAGALIGSAIQQQQQQYSNAIAWCASRYRSYDPRTQTYIGYNGRVYRCP